VAISQISPDSGPTEINVGGWQPYRKPDPKAPKVSGDLIDRLKADEKDGLLPDAMIRDLYKYGVLKK
jgi:hypothetical protein